jgi:hypothetical protein
MYEQLRANGARSGLYFGCGSGKLTTRACERGFDDFLGAATYYGTEVGGTSLAPRAARDVSCRSAAPRCAFGSRGACKASFDSPEPAPAPSVPGGYCLPVGAGQRIRPVAAPTSSILNAMLGAQLFSKTADGNNQINRLTRSLELLLPATVADTSLAYLWTGVNTSPYATPRPPARLTEHTNQC